MLLRFLSSGAIHWLPHLPLLIRSTMKLPLKWKTWPIPKRPSSWFPAKSRRSWLQPPFREIRMIWSKLFNFRIKKRKHLNFALAAKSTWEWCGIWWIQMGKSSENSLRSARLIASCIAFGSSRKVFWSLVCVSLFLPFSFHSWEQNALPARFASSRMRSTRWRKVITMCRLKSIRAMRSACLQIPLKSCWVSWKKKPSWSLSFHSRQRWLASPRQPQFRIFQRLSHQLKVVRLKQVLRVRWSLTDIRSFRCSVQAEWEWCWKRRTRNSTKPLRWRWWGTTFSVRSPGRWNVSNRS